jgi:hypothetical protein
VKKTAIATVDHKEPGYRMRLWVTRATPGSTKAVASITAIAENNLPALPLVGDRSDKERVPIGLDRGPVEELGPLDGAADAPA